MSAPNLQAFMQTQITKQTCLMHKSSVTVTLMVFTIRVCVEDAAPFITAGALFFSSYSTFHRNLHYSPLWK